MVAQYLWTTRNNAFVRQRITCGKKMAVRQDSRNVTGKWRETWPATGKPTIGAVATASYPGEQESLAGQIKKVACAIGIFPRRKPGLSYAAVDADVLRGVSAPPWPSRQDDLQRVAVRRQPERSRSALAPARAAELHTFTGYRPAMHRPSDARQRVER